MKTILDDLRKDLALNANEKDRVAGERFFKEEVKIMGLKSAVVGNIAKKHLESLPSKDKKTIFSLCEEFFSTGIMEESFVACNWSYSVRKQYEKSDFELFERWVRSYVTNWATCDTLCNHTIGTLVEMHPGLVERLKGWTGSGNRWVRRASAVSLIVPARKGLFLEDVFEIAGLLLTDTDDMVRKGYGWMLKVASQAHLQDVYGFVMRNKEAMPRTALRYAIEKMPPSMKAEAMKK